MLFRTQVELALALLVAARYGLTDSEMLDILCYEDLFHNDSYQGNSRVVTTNVKIYRE